DFHVTGVQTCALPIYPWETDDTKINEDYAIFFTKTIQTGEEGKYQFDLTYGDDHIFIYKNGVKVKQQQNAYTATPLYNFVTLDRSEERRVGKAVRSCV